MTFMDKNFMINNATGQLLYHQYAAKMPIFDYHCHLSAKEIAEDKIYKNITELWLGGDHYKWRLMRSNGVLESYITGDKSDEEKFMKFAETVAVAVGNPLYHWTHLELQRYFNINKTLSLATAKEIWEECNRLLVTPEFSAKSLIKKANVKYICTTDDPCDDLKYHFEIKKDENFDTKVLPTFRPDKGVNIDLDGFKCWVNSFEKVSGRVIKDVESLLDCLFERIDYFHEAGCRISDHGLEIVEYKKPNIEIANEVFRKAMDNKELNREEIAIYKGTIINSLGKKYSELGWTMQLHIGAIRNNSTRMFKQLGADTGFDSINDKTFAEELSQILDDLDITDELPKTIIYVLNPRDNYVIGTMIGNFQRGGVKGKIQFGSGWWFNDQRDGMTNQIKALANLGLLSNFVGMLTDSRSFTSFPRHEYFRRILCNQIGEWVERGEFPKDIELLGNLVENICYNNAHEYFGLK